MQERKKTLSFKTGLVLTKAKMTKNKELLFYIPVSHSDECLLPSGYFLEVEKIELSLLPFCTSCLCFLLFLATHS